VERGQRGQRKVSQGTRSERCGELLLAHPIRRKSVGGKRNWRGAHARGWKAKVDFREEGRCEKSGDAINEGTAVCGLGARTSTKGKTFSLEGIPLAKKKDLRGREDGNF